MKKQLLIWIITLLSVVSYAQTAKLEVFDKGKSQSKETVVLKDIRYDVKVSGDLSTTICTMVFQNKTQRILEGKLTFSLPDQVAVSGYAIDINGKLRDAVPVEKEKAKEVYESVRKRRIDPGMIEKVEGNNFRTRIYPIPANGSRTVQITYNMELAKQGQGIQYYLPLDKAQRFEHFELNVEVFENIQTPQLVENPDGSFAFQKNGSVWTASIKKDNYQPANDLRIAIPTPANYSQSVMQPAEGGHYYFLSNVVVPTETKAKANPKKIAIVWDNSLSGLQRNHSKEWELLDAYFQKLQNVEVDLYSLNIYWKSQGTFKVRNGNWDVLKQQLQQMVYDGGTDYGQLQPIKVDEILFFSDGITTFGTLKFPWQTKTYTIASQPKANFGQLQWMARTTGGEWINLNQINTQKALEKLTIQPLKFLGIKETSKVSEQYPSLPTSVDASFSVAGIVNQPKTTLTLLFGYGNTPTIERTLTLYANQQSTTDWNIAQFWAQRKIAELELFSEKNQEEIKEIGKTFGVVTHNTSLMVLEDVNDYVKYRITPPSELLAEYNRLIKNQQNEISEERVAIMSDAEDMIEDLKKWWNTDFKPQKKYPKPMKEEEDRDTISVDAEGTPGAEPNLALRGASSIGVNTNVSEEELAIYGSADKRLAEETPELEEVVVTSIVTSQTLQGQAAGINFSNNKNAKITTIEIQSDQDYMQGLNEQSSENLYTRYLSIREKYQTTPSFYFDIAQLLFKKNNREKGLLVLSSVADLDIENEELYKLLMYRLKEHKFYDKEWYIAGKVLEWRPFDPQSYRDYALACEDAGKPQEALDNLYKVLTNTYTQELSDRDRGIEETILMEINSLIARHKGKLDTSGINPKLIADLPVEIRVVLNWNKDDTDIDLWVIDPKGEKCFYSNNRTAIGGRLSNDFTSGFGPEQFILKKAIKGKYQIKTDFYGESQTSISGPTTLMAEIYIRYATRRQERKIVVFQSEKEKGKGDGVLIGEFEF